ncbi:hypothetical protein BD324DRAFT_654202 [Kockovaella imperatae]|uniref:Uncharacterized protein n=1 Tax=Kockovaella imperatae TaxID=4999 RepID=A0A1Y1U5R8_9TREE|nr:hypothetical protein BD324DRAFT_654202 [Kockovaella imperatae]ORX33370.1 hypothetical protein BD324DRAFT_654202 [Kockovaella imperatae]
MTPPSLSFVLHQSRPSPCPTGTPPTDTDPDQTTDSVPDYLADDADLKTKALIKNLFREYEDKLTGLNSEFKIVLQQEGLRGDVAEDIVRDLMESGEKLLKDRYSELFVIQVDQARSRKRIRATGDEGSVHQIVRSKRRSTGHYSHRQSLEESYQETPEKAHEADTREATSVEKPRRPSRRSMASSFRSNISIDEDLELDDMGMSFQLSSHAASSSASTSTASRSSSSSTLASRSIQESKSNKERKEAGAERIDELLKALLYLLRGFLGEHEEYSRGRNQALTIAKVYSEACDVNGFVESILKSGLKKYRDSGNDLNRLDDSYRNKKKPVQHRTTYRGGRAGTGSHRSSISRD